MWISVYETVREFLDGVCGYVYVTVREFLDGVCG